LNERFWTDPGAATTKEAKRPKKRRLRRRKFMFDVRMRS
jgi:hypothetical protein